MINYKKNSTTVNRIIKYHNVLVFWRYFLHSLVIFLSAFPLLITWRIIIIIDCLHCARSGIVLYSTDTIVRQRALDYRIVRVRGELQDRDVACLRKTGGSESKHFQSINISSAPHEATKESTHKSKPKQSVC